MLDDADYHDFGYYSADAVTPNIDSIAKNGVRLSRYYSAAPVCSPTRASVLTGNFPTRYGMNRVWPSLFNARASGYYLGLRGLPAYDQTIAQAMSNEGYRTFQIGKWHVGATRDEFLPKAKGFDSYELPEDDPTLPQLKVNTDLGVIVVANEWRAKYEAERVITEIDRAIAAGEDVFINWWPIEPHVVAAMGGLYVPPTFNRAQFDADSPGNTLDVTTKRGKALTMMHSFDVEFGKVIAHLRAKGLYNDSLVIVTSDNGGFSGGVGPSREVSFYKNSLNEGGLRVPFTASWPNRFGKGTHSDLPFQSADLFPTLLQLVGGLTVSGIDGRDLSGVLLRGTGQRRPMFFQTRFDSNRMFEDDRLSDSVALIDGCNKILRFRGSTQVFNVCKDSRELNDLSTSDPILLNSLRTALTEARIRSATYLRQDVLTGQASIANDARLDIHHDDISIYATVDLAQVQAGATQSIYSRGQGIDFSIDRGILTARLTGPANSEQVPPIRTITLRSNLPNRPGNARVGLVIRGYLSGGLTAELYVDGVRTAKIAAPIDQLLVAGSSIMAISSERVPAFIGDPTLSLTDYHILTLAVTPDEF